MGPGRKINAKKELASEDVKIEPNLKHLWNSAVSESVWLSIVPQHPMCTVQRTETVTGARAT